MKTGTFPKKRSGEVVRISNDRLLKGLCFCFFRQFEDVEGKKNLSEFYCAHHVPKNDLAFP